MVVRRVSHGPWGDRGDQNQHNTFFSVKRFVLMARVSGKANKPEETKSRTSNAKPPLTQRKATNRTTFPPGCASSLDQHIDRRCHE